MNYEKQKIYAFFLYCVPCSLWASSFYFMIIFFCYIFYDIDEKNNICLLNPYTIKIISYCFIIIHIILVVYTPSDNPKDYLYNALFVNFIAYLIGSICIFLFGFGITQKVLSALFIVVYLLNFFFFFFTFLFLLKKKNVLT